MNKFFTKVAGVALGLTLAIGVGVAVGSSQKETTRVTAAAGDKYKLVKDIDDLSSGDEILFGYADDDAEVYKANGVLNANTSSYLKAIDVSISNEILTYTGTTVAPLTLGKSNNYWTFTYVGSSSNVTVCTTAAKRMCVNGTSGSVSTWTISISDTGVATITSTTTSYGTIKYNSNDPRFLNYASGQKAIGIYKKAYTVTYDGNGTSSGTAVTDANSPYLSGKTVTVKNCTWTKEDYVFSHWNTDALGAGSSYFPEDNTKNTFTINANTTLYAQWVSASSDPYVSIATSFSGYTGQTPSISFATGNFTSLNVISDDNSVLEVTSFTSTSAALYYKGNGTANLLFKDTKEQTTTTIKSVPVSIDATTLTLNTNSASVTQGGSVTLTANTNIGGATWESNNAKVTVTNGVVSVAQDAVVDTTATITATSDVDSRVKAQCTITVLKAAPTITDSITRSDLDFGTSTGYADFSVKTSSINSNAEYVGYAYQTATDYIQMNNNPSGIVSTKSGGKRIKSVSIDINKGSYNILVYASNSPYESGADLFDADKDGELVATLNPDATSYTFTSNYRYIGIRKDTNAIYLNSITIVWELYQATEVVSNIKTMAGGWSNIVETNQCANHYNSAKEMILLMPSDELNTFKTSNDLEIKSARETYEWWCHINGDDSPWSGEIKSSARVVSSMSIDYNGSTSLIIIVISVVGLTAMGGYFLFKKKKQY